MTINITTPLYSGTDMEMRKQCLDKELYLNAYVVTRIVYEIIKLYMLNNPPENCGVTLAQKYNIEPAKSDILLDIGYNWRTKDMSKVPAVFVQREDVGFTYPTMGQTTEISSKKGSEQRLVLNSMPVIVTCVAQKDIAIVENLAEYVKQPLLYFRKEIQSDYGIRQFKLVKVGKPQLLKEGNNNFTVELQLLITFDDGWRISRESLAIKHIGVELFDTLMTPIQSFIE